LPPSQGARSAIGFALADQAMRDAEEADRTKETDDPAPPWPAGL